MSERLNQTDVALARQLRAVESASDAAIRASADLISTMLAACDARKVKPCQNHGTVARMGSIMADAIALRGLALTAHEEVALLGQSIGLPVTSWGQFCLATEDPSSRATLTAVDNVAA